MGSPRMTVVSPWIVGGSGRIRDLFELPPPLFFLMVFISNIVRHYFLTSFVVGFLLVWWNYGFSLLSALGITAGLGVVSLLLGTALRAVLARQWGGIGWLLQSVLRVFLVKMKWKRALFYGSVNERRDYDDVPNMWFIHPTKRGIRGFVWSGAKGLPLSRIPASMENINAAFGSADIRIKSLDAGDSKGWVEILWTDALRKTIKVADLGVPTSRELIPFGLNADGGVAGIDPQRSLLIVGESGSGKSSTLWSLMYGMQIINLPYRLYVIDPAGGVELSNLEHSEYTAEYVSRAIDAEPLVSRVRKQMNQVLDEMKREGIRKVELGDRYKLNIILIDELLLLKSLLKEGVDSPLGDILAVGRKAGFVVWTASQLAQADTLGRIRDLIPQRICMAVRSAHMTDAVLGVGAESGGAFCTKIPQSLPGVGYMYQEGQEGYTRFRSAYIDDDMAKYIAQGNGVDLQLMSILADPIEPILLYK